MKMVTRFVSYGSERIEYEIVERPRRRTLGIEVHPDARVLVLTPTGCDALTIADRVRRRAGWISRQLDMFTRYERHATPKHYLSGESHRYLGRQYRLRVMPHNPNADHVQVRLTRGELVVTGPAELPPTSVKDGLNRWYLGRAKEVFEAILVASFGNFRSLRYERPRIVIREMQGRWGSLSPRGRMTLNVKLVQVPRTCIEYVIVHELCHLVYKNHGAKFIAMLSKMMPDWESRKQRLEQALL